MNVYNALKSVQELHRQIAVKATSCPIECENHDDMDCPLDAEVAACQECLRIAEEANFYFTEEPAWADIVGWPCETAKRVNPALGGAEGATS